MDNKAILEKAIQKAIGGGWKRPHYLSQLNFSSEHESMPSDWYMWPSVIFNHEFAKALWGEHFWDMAIRSDDIKYLWHYHLQQMVIAEDPIKYLGDNI